MAWVHGATFLPPIAAGMMIVEAGVTGAVPVAEILKILKALGP